MFRSVELAKLQLDIKDLHLLNTKRTMQQQISVSSSTSTGRERGMEVQEEEKRGGALSSILYRSFQFNGTELSLSHFPLWLFWSIHFLLLYQCILLTVANVAPPFH